MYKPNYTKDPSAGPLFQQFSEATAIVQTNSVCWEETNVLLDFVVDSDFPLTEQDPEPWSRPADDGPDETKSFNYTPLFQNMANVLVLTFPRERFLNGFCVVYYAQYD